MMELRGRVAVVTGASEGIGAALAQRLGEAQCRVALVARSEPRLEQRARALRTNGVDASVFACDLANRATLERSFAAILDRYGQVDLLINNAGVGRLGPFLDMTPKEIAAPIDVPVTAALLAARLVAPSMIARGEGEIVNIVSPAAFFDLPYMVPYTTARVALLGFTRALASELHGTGVRVRAVCPAWVDTQYIERNGSDAGWFPAVSRWFPTHSAEHVASRILESLGSGRREHLLSSRLAVFAWAYRHFPRLSVSALELAGLFQPGRQRGKDDRMR